jgi:hypothetical protein
MRKDEHTIFSIYYYQYNTYVLVVHSTCISTLVLYMCTCIRRENNSNTHSRNFYFVYNKIKNYVFRLHLILYSQVWYNYGTLKSQEDHAY